MTKINEKEAWNRPFIYWVSLGGCRYVSFHIDKFSFVTTNSSLKGQNHLSCLKLYPYGIVNFDKKGFSLLVPGCCIRCCILRGYISGSTGQSGNQGIDNLSY